MVGQTILLVLVAAFVGAVFGWFLRGRFTPPDFGESQVLERELAAVKADHARCEAALAQARLSEGEGAAPGAALASTMPSYGLTAPMGEKDDLKRIGGVGPVLEKKLNGLGIFHYAQVAAFTSADIEKIDAELNFKGRIERDNWIDQAKKLASGQDTDFASRYDEGDAG
ncbi:MAG: hypothetical protein AAF220_06300 [Pseudomonadota bacterium]